MKKHKKNKEFAMESPMKMPPEMSLDERDLPEIKHMQVGGKHHILLHVEHTHLGQDQYGPKKDPMRARFRILHAKHLKGKLHNPKVDREKSDENTKYGYPQEET